MSDLDISMNRLKMKISVRMIRVIITMNIVNMSVTHMTKLILFLTNLRKAKLSPKNIMLSMVGVVAMHFPTMMSLIV